MRRRSSEYIISAPPVLWMSVFFLIPLLLIFAISFHPASPSGEILPGWTLQTWKAITNPDYPTIIFRTLWISAAATFACICLALPCSYAMARMAPRMRNIVGALIIIPFWTNFLIRVFAWRIMLHPDGYVKHFLMLCGLADQDTMLLYNSPAILLVSIYTFLPFAILPIYAAAEKFDFSLLEAAKDLGCTSIKAFFRVFVPGVRQGIFSAVLMVFIPALGSYVIPDLVGGPNSEMIGNKIAQRTFAERNLPQAAALSTVVTVSVLIALVLLVIWNRRQNKRVSEGKESFFG